MKRSLFSIFISIISISIWGQISKTDILGAYIYNFAELSDSPMQSDLPVYNIVVISDNTEVISEFKRMQKETSIKKKPIKLTIDSNGDYEYNTACLIFISEEKSHLYPEIFRKTKETQALLVTENYSDKTQIMLNLYKSDNKLKFEMNKGNIYSRNIEIDDEVLLMGGNVIDLAEMYVNSQSQLKDIDAKLNLVQDSLGELGEKLVSNQEKISNQKEKLISQKSIINKQNKEYNTLTTAISSYKQQINKHKEAYLQSEKKLSDLNDSLIKAKDMLNIYHKQVSKNEDILKQQQGKINKNQKILNEKNYIIQTQRTLNILFTIGITITLLLLLLLIRSHRNKIKKNALLKQQKEEIEEHNKILKKNNKLIESMMDELSEKNQELETSLEENKRIQNKLVQSEKMASLGVLSAGIAHEINNPINFVYAGINSLLRDFEDIEPVINEVSKININSTNIKEKLENIQKLKEENYFDEAMEAIPEILKDIKLGADRTAEIVKGLRNFTRMDQNTYEKLNINQGLDTSLLLLKNKYKNRIDIIKNYDSTLPELLCYPGKINQAFLNIISNAVDSISDKGTIWISTKTNNDHIDISIKDSGSGIPQEIQTKIFDPFFTTKAVGEGTGLGLSITFGIIEDHYGTIDVISEDNSGSEFIIKLPLN